MDGGVGKAGGMDGDVGVGGKADGMGGMIELMGVTKF